MKFQVVTIAVSDLERSKAFYEDVLGSKRSASYERWQSYEIEGGSGFGISEDPDSHRVPCHDIFNFTHRDIDALWEKVRDHVRVESPPQAMPWGTRKLVILDPDGMRLAFVEKKED
ncbi:MAG: VOC family protein [Anaerolineae bacterium]|nr:VOC family protein [Anaerolineae bacterium]